MENLYYYLFPLFLSVFLIIIKIPLFRINRKRNYLPPSPLALPVIGHLHLINKPLHQALEPLSSRYGPILYLRFGSRPVVVVSSPSAVEECFTKNDVVLANRPRTMASDHFSYNYANYGFSPYGDIWRTLRRFTVIELFSSNGLHKYSTVREEVVIGLCRKLFTLSSSSSSTGDQKVDLKFLFSLLTSNIMLRVIAGKRGVEENLVELEKQFLKEFKERFFPSMSMNVCDFIPILRKVGYKGMEKSLIRVHKMRDGYLQSLIDQVQLKRSNTSSSLEPNWASDDEEEKKKSVIETLFSLQESDPEFYSDDVIKGIILILFIGGTDTTGATLEWAMSLLLSNPEVMHKLRAEIDCNVGYGHLLNDLDLTKLPYLRCIINETLRLYPPAPILLPHSSSKSCTVGGYEIPRDTMVLVNAWAMHRDPNLWEDATKFKPERFEGMLGEREGFKYIPFGAGRRACPGAVMAVQTVSLALGALIQCFEWGKVEQEVDMSEAVGVTLSKAKPLEAMCHPRQNLIQLLSQL